jgi:hypothetical protein
MLLAQGGHGGFHGKSGRQSIVHDDYGLPFNLRRRPVVTIELFAAFQFFSLARSDKIEDLSGDAQFTDDRLVYDANTAGRDGAHTKFLMTWHAKLSHNEHIQWSVQFSRDLDCHRYSPTRKSQNNDIRLVPITLKIPRKRTACVGTIVEIHFPSGNTS